MGRSSTGTHLNDAATVPSARNAQLPESLGQRIERTDQFNRLCLLSGSQQTLEDYLPRALEHTIALLRGDSGSVLLRGELVGRGQQRWVTSAASGFPGWEKENLTFLEEVEGEVRRLARTRSAITMPQTARYRHLNERERELLERWGVGSGLGTRLYTPSGQTVGLMFVNWTSERAFTKDDIKYLAHAAPVIGRTIDQLIADRNDAHEGSADVRANFLRRVLVALAGESLSEVARVAEEMLGFQIQVVTPGGDFLHPYPSANPQNQPSNVRAAGAQSDGDQRKTVEGAIPITANGMTIAYLVPEPGDLQELHPLLVETAELMSSCAIRAWERNFLNPDAESLLSRLLSSDDRDSALTAEVAVISESWPTPYRLFVLRDVAQLIGRADLERLQRGVTRVLNADVSCTHENDVVCLLAARDVTPSELAELRVLQDATESASPNISLVSVLTRDHSSPRMLRAAYREATRVAGLAGSLGLRKVMAPEELGLYELLLLEDDNRRGEFVHRSIGQLLIRDRVHGSDLVQSLEAFLDENGSISAAAARLYVHPNTLRYRLSRVRELVRWDLDNPDQRLAIHLAIKLSPFVDVADDLGRAEERGQTAANRPLV